MADFEFAILGAGAMGSIIGAHLARAGHTVAMLARGERARQLEERGLAIRGLAEFSTPVRTLRDPAALESAGTLIVATKTPGTAQALEPLRRAELGVALSVQNGPLKNEILVQAFGRERVLGALADTSGELLADGTVLFTRNVNIMIGELGGGDSERAQALARTIDQSGVRAAATPEIVSLEWSKFCGWVGLTSQNFDHSRDRKSTRLNSSHSSISYAVFCLKKKNQWYEFDYFLPLGVKSANSVRKPLN